MKVGKAVSGHGRGSWSHGFITELREEGVDLGVEFPLHLGVACHLSHQQPTFTRETSDLPVWDLAGPIVVGNPALYKMLVL